GAGCPSCSGGQGTFTYAYGTNLHDPAGNTNYWKNKTEERQFAADGVTLLYLKTVFTNLGGEVLLEAMQDPATGNEWSHYYRYDMNGRPVLHAMPSALTGTVDQYARYDDLLHCDVAMTNCEFLKDDQGLIETYAYSGDTATLPTEGTQ